MTIGLFYKKIPVLCQSERNFRFYFGNNCGFGREARPGQRSVSTIANEVKNRMRWSNRNYGCSDAALRTRPGSRLADVIRDLGAARTKTRLAQCRESRARRTHEFARSARRASRTFLVSVTLANGPAGFSLTMYEETDLHALSPS